MMRTIQVCFVGQFDDQAEILRGLKNAFNGSSIIDVIDTLPEKNKANVAFVDIDPALFVNGESVHNLRNAFDRSVLLGALRKPDQEYGAWLLRNGMDDVLRLPTDDTGYKIIGERAKNALRRYQHLNAINVCEEDADQRADGPPAEIEINTAQKVLIYKGRKIYSFSPIHLKILSILTARPLCYHDRDTIMAGIHNNPGAVEDRSIDSSIKRIRRVLKKEQLPGFIETKYGLGYRFNPQPPTA